MDGYGYGDIAWNWFEIGTYCVQSHRKAIAASFGKVLVPGCPTAFARVSSHESVFLENYGDHRLKCKRLYWVDLTKLGLKALSKWPNVTSPLRKGVDLSTKTPFPHFWLLIRNINPFWKEVLSRATRQGSVGEFSLTLPEKYNILSS